MNDQSQSTPPQSPAPMPPPSGDWHDQRRAEREARRQARNERHGRHHFGWLWGLVLILLGGALLLQNMGYQFAANWWALLILIPAFWSYVAAWDQYQDNGRLTRGAASSATVGILLTLLSLVFLFNIDFGVFWPALLIVAGVALLSVGLVPR